jgi:cation diffusion facilitator CzcD-associated flavoprotein CzcO
MLTDSTSGFTNILEPILLYYFCRFFPVRAISFLRGQAQKSLPPDFAMDPNFKPAYNPWEQRLCFSPDGDYFECFKSKRAQVITDTIKNVTENGIELSSGERLDADIIVTATGLQMQFFGGVNPTLDGQPVHVPSEYLWRYTMITSLPNFGNIIGHWNHSWTLGSDTSIHMYIRLIKRMQAEGYTSVRPQMSEKDKQLKDVSASPLHSTYIQVGSGLMPKCKEAGVWGQRDNHFVDRWKAERCGLEEGLRWEKVST